MNKNQDHIWDTLIEDAMREAGASPPQQPGEYTRRLLTPVGAPGVDRGRSLRGPSRRKWAPVAVTALALVLVVVALYAATTWLPQLTQPEPTSHPQAADETNQSPPRQRWSNSPSPAPTPRPEPQDAGPADSGEPTPNDGSKPEPKPDDAVEQPRPQPDDTVEQPKPDTTPEPKPDGTVEQPKQPEGTAPEPDSKLRVNLLTRFDWTRRDSKELLYSTDGENWLSTRYLTDFAADTWLRSTKAVDFEAGGVLVRLKGTAHLKLGDTLEIELTDEDVYFDNRGARRGVSLRLKSNTLVCAGGDALVSQSVAGDSLRVYSGEVTVGETIVLAGQQGEWKRSGFVLSRKPLKDRSAELLLQGLVDRVIYHEDFEADPKGRLREGTLNAGVISGPTVFWGYPENIQFEPGMVIRLRVRCTGTEAAMLTQFSLTRNDNYSVDLAVKPDEWQLLEVPVGDFLERTTHKQHPTDHDFFQNVSISLEGKNAQVELDWVELIRAVK